MAESVFHALGLPDADEQVAKADLALAIIQRLEARGLNNSRAAEATGIARQEIVHLKAARLSRFTLDRLIRALNRLDRDARVRLVVEARQPLP
jgi:predicted XRE-type DNA-binding protein